MCDVDPAYGATFRRERIRQEQNSLEEDARALYLARNLFHDHFFKGDHIAGQLDADLTAQDWAELNQEFYADKVGKNMGERFAMALSEKYFDKIHVVELGLTEHPSADGEIDGLKHEWTDLRDWMIAQGLIDDELSRSESHRTFSYRRSQADVTQVVVVRTRPLVITRVDEARVVIYKRMVFAMPKERCVRAVDETGSRTLDDEPVMEYIENLLETKHPSLTAIRTGYYMASERYVPDPVDS